MSGNEATITQTMTIEEERKPAFEILSQIEAQLKRDSSLSDQEREDLVTNVDMIRGQLRKREPSRLALAALLQPLGQVASVAGFVVNLIKLLNP